MTSNKLSVPFFDIQRATNTFREEKELIYSLNNDVGLKDGFIFYVLDSDNISIYDNLKINEYSQRNGNMAIPKALHTTKIERSEFFGV